LKVKRLRVAVVSNSADNIIKQETGVCFAVFEKLMLVGNGARRTVVDEIWTPRVNPECFCFVCLSKNNNRIQLLSPCSIDNNSLCCTTHFFLHC
jgi:hypothetical protein